jgi:hypothetical protein
VFLGGLLPSRVLFSVFSLGVVAMLGGYDLVSTTMLCVVIALMKDGDNII